MEQLLRVFAAALLLAGLASACGRPKEAEEKRDLEKSISAAQDRAHQIKMKEANGAELSAEELAEKQRLLEQAAEDSNEGTLPDEMRPRPEPQEEPTAP